MADPEEDAVVVAFLQRYAEDCAAAGPRSLPSYQCDFPGFEAAIEREFARLSDDNDNAQQSDRYAERGELGRGGMAVVRGVFDRDMRRELAMKTLRADASVHSRTRFADEARITGQLSHPGVIPVHEFGVDHLGQPFFTMPLVRGRDLRAIFELVAKGAEDWTRTRAIGVLVRVCEAVAFAHDKGVIHRDLKPANIMVGEFGETYVMDWGLARVLEDESAIESLRTHTVDTDHDSPVLTLAGDVLGTPAYMAPEQARGEVDSVDKRSDVFAIGAMLYHLLTSHMPYSGSASSSQKVLDCVVDGPPRPLDQFAGIPAELVAICEQAMARAPADRYQSVALLGADLSAFLELRVVRAYETGALAELRKWIRRNRTLAATGAFAILALIAGLVLTLELKTRADDQARRADANFELASDAVDEVLTRIARDRLVEEPRMQRLRRDVIQSAVGFYRELVERRKDDLQARADVAGALGMLAQLHKDLGDYEASERCRRDAIEGYEQLIESGQRDLGTLRARADQRIRLGKILTARGELDDSLAQYEIASDELSEFLEVAPDDFDLLKSKTDVATNIAIVHTRRRDFEAAVGPQLEVIELGRKLLAMRPTDVDAIGLTCVALKNHAVASMELYRKNPLDQLRDTARANLEEAERIAATSPQPERRYHRRMVADVLSCRAWVENAFSDFDAAAAALDRAVGTIRALANDFPDVAQYHADLGAGLNNLANLRSQIDPDDPQTLIPIFRESVTAHTRSRDLAPDNPGFAFNVEFTRRRMCDFLVRTRDHRALAESAEALAIRQIRQHPPDESAFFLCVCVSIVQRDYTLPNDERARLIEEYGARAVRRLREIAGTGYTTFDRDVYELLAEREDYIAFRRELEK